MKSKIPWSRYALLAELMHRCPYHGSTALQRMVFLLQELYGVALGYRFSLYAHGPVSADLLMDLALVESIGPDALRGKVDAAIYEPLEKLIADFGFYSTKDLELRATIFCAVKDTSKSTIFSTVRALKPLFTDIEIQQAIDEMLGVGL